LILENETTDSFTLSLQLIGALFCGLGLINWMVKEGLIGGIYNRPIVFGNLMHFLIGFFAVIKALDNYSGTNFLVMAVVAVSYMVFTITFDYLLISSPPRSRGMN